MVRVPTYASYMSLVNQTMKTKATANMYGYQSATGIKYANYAGYGMKASNIVNMEASLGVTQNFMDNNILINTSIKTMSTVMENVENAVSSFKSQLNNSMSAFSSLTDGEPISAAISASINELQTVAFSAMSLISDALNQSIGGKYIFGAGSSSQPTQFPYATLDDFQKMYDGINIKYPETSNAVLASRSADYISAGDLTISQSSAADNEFVLSSTNGFLSTAVEGGTNTTGNLVFSAVEDTLHAEVYGAFSTIQAGDTMIFDNNGTATAYIVESVSTDGKTIKFVDDITADSTIADGSGVTISTSFAVGTVLNFSGTADVPSQMQVIGINDNGELTVRANPEKFSSLPQTVSAATRWNLQSNSYYTGGSAQETLRISENQTITFDINANDAVFTKLFRAFGAIAQGNVLQTDENGNIAAGQSQAFRDLVEEAMSFLQSAIDNNGKAYSGKNETLSMCIAKISANYVTLNNTNNNLESQKNNLEDNIYNIKNVDQTEAAAKLLFAQNSLEASYQVLSGTLDLSLLNYLK